MAISGNYIYLKPPNNLARIYTTSTVTGDIDITFTVTNVRQVNATPADYECAAFEWHASATSSTNYRLEFLTDGMNLTRDGTSIASDWGSTANSVVGAIHTIRVTHISGVINVYRDGTLLLTATDSTYSSGYIKLRSYACESKFDSLSGTITEDFSGFSAGAWASGTVHGQWTVETDGGGTVSIASDSTPANVTVTGLSATSVIGATTQKGKANLTLSGMLSTSAVGAVTTGVYTAVQLSGFGLTGYLGTTTQSGAASLVLPGLSAASTLGGVTITIASGAALSGLEAIAAIGGVVATGSARITLSGLNATLLLGTPVDGVGITLLLDGLEGIAYLGDITQHYSRNVNLTAPTLRAEGCITPPFAVAVSFDILPSLQSSSYNSSAGASESSRWTSISPQSKWS